MTDNKKISQIQAKLNEAIRTREVKKVRYDAHVVILEGQRRTLAELERINQDLLSELMEAGNAVSEFNKQLQEAVNETQSQNNDNSN